MTKVFEVNPRVGIGKLNLGTSRDEVLSQLGSANYSGKKGSMDCYFNYSIQVEFTEEVSTFIGVSYSDKYELLYLGQNVFDLEAESLFKLIAENEEEDHAYNSYEYLFPTQIITLWDADPQYDRIKAEERSVWAEIGIGSEVYLAARSA